MKINIFGKPTRLLSADRNNCLLQERLDSVCVLKEKQTVPKHETIYTAGYLCNTTISHGSGQLQ